MAAHATDFSPVHKAVRHQCMDVTGLNDFGNAVTEMIKNAPIGTLLVERPVTPNEHLNKFCLNFPMQVYEKKAQIWTGKSVPFTQEALNKGKVMRSGAAPSV